jgi:chemotaxis protein MotC
MSTLRLAVVLLAVALSPAHGEEQRSPSDLVRTLQVLQDQIAAGDMEAYRTQRAMLAQVAEQLSRAAPEAWKEPRNARALVAFVLSGGDVRILRRVLALGVLPGVKEELVRGVLAYGEGRDAEAAGLLVPIAVRSLDPSIAGNVAFVQAELVAKKEPKKALALLDEARLLSPGTLIEEAALRRQVAVVASTGDLDRFEALSATYLRRFPRSAYAGAFRQQFAADVAGREDADDAGRMDRMAAVLEQLGGAERGDAYLSIAQEALARGKVGLARFAARAAVQLTQEEEADQQRAKLYEAAALVVGGDSEAAAQTLTAIDKSRLVEEDAELLKAAQSVAAEVGRLPAAEAGAAPGPEDSAVTIKADEPARQAIARTDQIIAAASR